MPPGRRAHASLSPPAAPLLRIPALQSIPQAPQPGTERRRLLPQRRARPAGHGALRKPSRKPARSCSLRQPLTRRGKPRSAPAFVYAVAPLCLQQRWRHDRGLLALVKINSQQVSVGLFYFISFFLLLSLLLLLLLLCHYICLLTASQKSCVCTRAMRNGIFAISESSSSMRYSKGESTGQGLCFHRICATSEVN